MINKAEIFDEIFEKHFEISYSTQHVLKTLIDESSSMYEWMESYGKDNPYVKNGRVSEVDYYDLEDGIFGAMIIYVALGDLEGNLPHLLSKLNWSYDFECDINRIISLR